MAVIVVGGSGRGAGKTALVCGLIRALPEIPWTAIKVTSHGHGKPTPSGKKPRRGRGPTLRAICLPERDARCW